MKRQFVGAATTVTGSQFLLTYRPGARVLVDCGMFQGPPSDVERNRAALPYDPGSLDAVLLTHAHLGPLRLPAGGRCARRIRWARSCSPLQPPTWRMLS